MLSKNYIQLQGKEQQGKARRKEKGEGRKGEREEKRNTVNLTVSLTVQSDPKCKVNLGFRLSIYSKLEIVKNNILKFSTLRTGKNCTLHM